MRKPTEDPMTSNGVPCRLPDVSHEERPTTPGLIDQVGMEGIETPIVIRGGEGEPLELAAKMDVYVSLDQSEAKGIHMSRLYLEIQKDLACRELSASVVESALRRFVEVQGGLSKNAYVRIEFDLPVKRKALLSQEVGWRQYPILVEGRFQGGRFDYVLGATVTYSSTCPCSAALARQLVSEKFLRDFSGVASLSPTAVAEWLTAASSIVATPHAQRSWARFKVQLMPGETEANRVIELIDRVEEVLGTPVQAAVKRQDEQEFARLNGENLMFCEDAVRRIKTFFDSWPSAFDYHIHVEHFESLHPHSAVSVAVKGVPGGFRPWER